MSFAKTLSIPEQAAGRPTLAGYEEEINEAMSAQGPIYLPECGIDFGRIRSGFACALHMHQPMIPAGGDDLGTATIISNLKHMSEHGDGYNAGIFRWCYKRMAEFIPQLVEQGRQPRIMLDYSGCLLWGLREMGANDVLDALRALACDPVLRRHVEFLGTAWGHAVAPSTPFQDFRLHVRAWQHHFAGMFGPEALSRVRGFSTPEMALPNHPDVAYEFVKTLRDCGYRWVLVQEHTIEHPDGWGVRQAHLPHRLVVRSSRGETASIIALIKTQGSDTKLVAQMQPCYEARGLSRQQLDGRDVPPLVSQIADGENGGVMMNEFPAKYQSVMAECSGSDTPAVNGTEYLEYLEACGVREEQLPVVQPIMQKRLWERVQPGCGSEAMEAAIEQLRREDGRFNMEGGSWTNNISWVRGYESVLGPMDEASAMFAQKALAGGVDTRDYRFQNALYHLLLSQTSCYRYWGAGRWTDYGKEIVRRTMEILRNDF